MDNPAGQGVNWWRFVGWGVSLLALGFVVRWLIGVDRSAWRSLTGLNRLGLIASLVVFQLWFVLRYLGWEWVSRRFGGQAKRSANVRMWTLSELARYLPGNVWSFAARYRGVRAAGAERSSAVSALVVEAAGLVSGATVVAGFSMASLFGQTKWIMVIGVLLIFGLGKGLINVLARRIGALRPLAALSWPEIGALCLWYGLVWVVFGVANAVLLGSFPQTAGHATYMFYGVASILAWLIGYLSLITPMGLGVREVTLVKFLTGSETLGVASLMSIVSRLWLVISELVFLGIVMIFSRRP